MAPKESAMSTFKRFVLSSILLLIPSILSAQDPVVKGRVTDPSGLPIQNAAVRLENGATGQNTSVLTNIEGNYVFPPSQPGRYSISVTSNGLRDARIDDLHLEVGGSRV